MLNDQRVVATAGRNTVTGQSGAVLLTPAGLLPPPAAPTGLTATPHPATSSEPYMSINLSWNNGDVLLTRTYELERRVFGQTAWTSVNLVPPAMSTFHQDTTVGAGDDLRLPCPRRGRGRSGPVVGHRHRHLARHPARHHAAGRLHSDPGQRRHGIRDRYVSAQATDNVGVEFLEISFWNQYLGQEVILGSVANSGSLTVNWDTRGLTPATYTVWAFANDAIGNWTQDGDLGECGRPGQEHEGHQHRPQR